MSGAEPSPYRLREDTDVAEVVGVLHRAGPLRMRDLACQPEVADWSAQRLEHAVVSAWSTTLIFVDQRDLLVAIGAPHGW
jgi:hypothetical protein